MKTFATLLAFCLVASVGAQQPNSPQASLRINGQDGPPYPVLNTPLPRGLPQTVRVQSLAANAPFIVFGGPALRPFGTPVLGGELLDVNISQTSWTVMDWNQNPAFNTGFFGDFQSQYVVSATATVGTTAGVQALVADPTNAPYGSSLTAAFGVTIVQGLTVVPLLVGSNTGLAFDFTPYSLTFPFYASTYTRTFVNEDGNLTFNSSSGDFTPSPAEFQSLQPRIAGFWTDLERSYAPAAIRATVNQSPLAGFPSVRFDYVDMAEWSNVGARHSFSMELNMLTGDIRVIQDPFNIAMVYDQFMGIGPGVNLLPPGQPFSAQRDLSTLAQNPVTLAPNEAIWEWFGLANGTQLYYTPTFSNPWDMVGRTVNFYAIGAGVAGAYYYCN